MPRPSRCAESQWACIPTSLASRADWADLDVLCLTAMHKDPQRRYGTAKALLRDIDNYLKAEAVLPSSLRMEATLRVAGTIYALLNGKPTLQQIERFNKTLLGNHRASEHGHQCLPAPRAVQSGGAIISGGVAHECADPARRSSECAHHAGQAGTYLARQARWVEAESQLLAGHAIVAKLSDPGVSWLKAAREDLVKVYEATGHADKAARWRN